MWKTALAVFLTNHLFRLWNLPWSIGDPPSICRNIPGPLCPGCQALNEMATGPSVGDSISSSGALPFSNVEAQNQAFGEDPYPFLDIFPPTSLLQPQAASLEQYSTQDGSSINR